MNAKLKEKINEAFSSVLPVSIIVLLLDIMFVGMSLGTLTMFLVGVALLIVGMGLFSLGADIAMMPIGESVGVQITKTKKIWFIVLVCFLLGVIITIAEPDLQVLAGQVPAIPNMTIVLTVAVGVGLFLVIAILRVLLKINLSLLLFIFYGIMFILAIFVPGNFLAVAFDSGGVTTGPITVPFILAMGIGLASVRGDKDSKDDSFGFVALCSIGPILAVMLLGIFYNPQEAAHSGAVIPEVETMRDVLQQFAVAIPECFKEVLIAVLPIAAFFFIFQIISKRFRKRQLLKICVGLVYTLVGLVMFLAGVEVGFIPVGTLLGGELAGSAYKWLLIPIGMLIGYFIVAAEPAVHVLNIQVEEISGGAIPKKAMSLCLSIGVAVSVGLAMVRVLTGISIMWFLIPGYAISLFLTFKVPKIFTGVAFDSGGVASGPMTSTFLLPFAIGACEAAGGNVMTDAFGIVAMVAMTPLIAIQVMGYFYKGKMVKQNEESAQEMDEILSLYTQDEQEVSGDEH